MTTIAVASLIYAVYLGALVFIEIIRLHAAGALHFPFRFAWSMPDIDVYAISGMSWGFITWGLFRLQNWARMAAVLLMGTALAFEVTSLAMRGRFHRWLVVEMFVQLVVIWYFFRMSVLDQFLKSAKTASNTRSM